MDWGGSKRDHLVGSLVEYKVRSKAGKHLLSPAGKEVLIKTVLQAIPTYVMSVFQLPVRLCKDLSCLIANFWWHSNKGKTHWIAWKEISKPKFEGGLGFKDFVSFNQALLAKQAWRVTKEENTLWVQILKSRYFPSCSFGEAKKGDGKTIRVWEDKWVPKVGMLKNVVNSDIKKVCELLHPLKSEWKTDVLESLFSSLIVDHIKTIPMSFSKPPDRIIWPYTPNGEYTVKSGYKSSSRNSMSSGPSRASSSFQIDSRLWKLIWKLACPPKIKYFLWKASKIAISTAENLYKRTIRNSPIFSLCCKEVETTEHVLLLCSAAQDVWQRVSKIDSPSNFSMTRFDKWLLSILNSSLSVELTCFIGNICWFIWKQRNAYLFKGETLKSNFCLANARLLQEEIFKVQEPGSSLQSNNELCSEWSPPNESYMKIKTNFAFIAKEKIGYVGIVVRDYYGQFIAGAYKKLCCDDPTIGEALAVREACRLSQTLGLEKNKIESDSLIVVKECLKQDGCDFLWKIYNICCDIRSFLKQNQQSTIRCVRRSANKAAHWIATAAKQGKFEGSWISSMHPQLSKILEQDCRRDIG